MKLKYPGTSGRVQGARKVRRPAMNDGIISEASIILIWKPKGFRYMDHAKRDVTELFRVPLKNLFNPFANFIDIHGSSLMIANIAILVHKYRLRHGEAANGLIKRIAGVREKY